MLSLGKVEFTNHAKWDGSTAWLGVIQLALKENGVDSLFLSKNLGSTSSRRSSSDNGDLVLHAKGAITVGSSTVGHRGRLEERGRRGKGRSRGGNCGKCKDAELHRVFLIDSYFAMKKQSFNVDRKKVSPTKEEVGDDDDVCC